MSSPKTWQKNLHDEHLMIMKKHHLFNIKEQYSFLKIMDKVTVKREGTEQITHCE